MADRTALVNSSNLTPIEETHIVVMKAIAMAVADTPMVLKGGTALLLVYGLDRFSEDLDFDSNKAINLENRIQQAGRLLAPSATIIFVLLYKQLLRCFVAQTFSRAPVHFCS